METNRLYYPPPTQDLQYAFDCNVETKQRFNMDRRLDLAVKEGTIQPASTTVESLTMQQHQFNARKRKCVWLEHHSKCTVKHGKCKWEQCPGYEIEMI